MNSNELKWTQLNSSDHKKLFDPHNCAWSTVVQKCVHATILQRWPQAIYKIWDEFKATRKNFALKFERDI